MKKSSSFRRKREKRTDYRRRLKLLLSKKSRLVIRKSLKSITLQMIDYAPEGDKIIVSTNSKALSKLGWTQNTGNTCAAYLTGLVLGKKAKKAGIKEAILDIGFITSTPGSRVYAALKGVIDAGINIPAKKDVLPDEKRIHGEHIISYAEKKPGKFTKINPGLLKQEFENVERKIKENEQ